MSITICEYSGFRASAPGKENSFSLREERNLDYNTISETSLMVEIEGIHAYPYSTRNFTRYMPECLNGSIPTWTKPYRRPLIKFHNESDGEIIGRIISVEYKLQNTLSGTPALVFTVNIPKEDVKQDVHDGTLVTVSIGIIAHKVKCSICGHNIAAEGLCEHSRGEEYDGHICYWDVYEMEAKELSYVIVPSDIYAKNINCYPAISNKRPQELTENFAEKKGGQKLMQTGDNNQSTLEKDIKALALKIDSLHETMQKLNEDLTKKFADFESNPKLAELVQENKALTESKEKLAGELAEANEKLVAEKTLKETIENEVLSLKEQSKKALVEDINRLRLVKGQVALEEAALAGRSNDSLKDTIADLYREMTESMQNKLPPQVLSNALVDNEENNNQPNVKEAKTHGNNDAEKVLEELFG